MTQEEKKPKFMTVKDFALLKHISVQAVYQGLKAGTYDGKKIGNYQLVKVD